MMEFENALPYDINIKGSANKGFIVRAGCCTCVFTDKGKMLDAIDDFIDDPKKMEDSYNEATKHARPQPIESSGSGPTRIGGRRTAAVPINEVIDMGGDCSCEEERSR